MENVSVQENMGSGKTVFNGLHAPERTGACQDRDFAVRPSELDESLQVTLFTKRKVSVKAIDWDKILNRHARIKALHPSASFNDWQVLYKIACCNGMVRFPATSRYGTCCLQIN